MTATLLTTEIRSEPDVVLARQRARLLAELLGFDLQDQTRVATAVSEVARNAFQYAGGGRVQFLVRPDNAFTIRITDSGPGIAELRDVLEGRYTSTTGMGTGLLGARRLMDGFEIQSGRGRGTSVELRKVRPQQAKPLTAQLLASISAALAARAAENPFEEVRQQNQELLRALQEIREREEDLTRLNHELAETNTGVMALYAEIEEKAEALRKANQLQARFHSQMNHEVRTPINAILSLSEILLNGTVASPLPEQNKPLSLIRKSAQHLSELIDDLLDLAKLEAGKMAVRRECFSISDLLGALRGTFRPLHSNDAVRLIFEDAAQLPRICSDEGKISQILRNFISNALKFTESGEVRVSAKLDAEHATFEVRDTGIGIRPDDQQRLFREFSQIHSPRHKTVKGTGLGLAVSRSLAEILGGRVSVTSVFGQGSTFSLSIPRTPKPDEEAARPEPGATTGGLLIVDDDEAARYLLRNAIGEGPWSVVEAGGGAEGLEQAKVHRPSAIFLDLVMPELSGFEVLDRLKADPETRDIPIIINTSRELSERERKQLESQAVAILNKSEAPADVASRVHEALRVAGLDRASR